MSRHQFHVATSFLPTVGFPGCDTKIPGRDLPHCHPCRDLKNDVTTSNPFGQITTSNFQVATPKGHPHIVTSNPCRDAVFTQSEQTRSRPQGEVATPNSQCPPAMPKSQVAKPETYCNPARSRHHFLVATSRPTKPGRDLD